MKKLSIIGVVTAGFLAGCAASPQLVECLQPDRRVVVEFGGTRIKPPPKPKPGAKPAAKPAKAPAKPASGPYELAVNVQGNTAWDPGKAELKPEGQAELDKAMKTLGDKKLPITIGSIIITGHSDRLEAREGDTSLSEARAKAVMDYLVSKGQNKNLMFWEGRGSKQPVPVTKFCES